MDSETEIGVACIQIVCYFRFLDFCNYFKVVIWVRLTFAVFEFREFQVWHSVIIYKYYISQLLFSRTEGHLREFRNLLVPKQPK